MVSTQFNEARAWHKHVIAGPPYLAITNIGYGPPPLRWMYMFVRIGPYKEIACPWASYQSHPASLLSSHPPSSKESKICLSLKASTQLSEVIFNHPGYAGAQQKCGRIRPRCKTMSWPLESLAVWFCEHSRAVHCTCSCEWHDGRQSVSVQRAECQVTYK